MSSSVDGALDTVVTSQGTIQKNFDLSDNTNNAVCDPNVMKRYNRSKLVAIRQSLQSRYCPKSNIKADLKALGIWKINNNGNFNQNGARSSNDCFNMSAVLDQSVHMAPARSNTRRYRSPPKPEQRMAYNGSNPSQTNLSEYSISKTFVDHRSISSSHLMPAFAKKKIAASTMPHSKLFLNGTGIGSSSLIGTRSQTPTDYKNGVWNSNVSIPNNAPSRHRVKAQLHECRHHVKSRGANGIDIIAAHDEGDRCQELHGQSLSPIVGSRQNHFNVGIVNERRIGSGRLIPRQVDWECHTIHDNEKNSISKVLSVVDKNSPRINHFGRHDGDLCTDRRFDHTACTEHISERTLVHCRGSGDEHASDTYECSHNTKSSETHNFVFAKEDTPRLEHSSLRNRNTRNYQRNERNEEPEWFSGGPTSQHDTIELRGFEDIDEVNNIVGASGNINRISMFTPTRKISESSASRESSTLTLHNSKSRELTHVSQNHGNDTNPSTNISQNVVPTGFSDLSPKSSISLDEEENNLLERNHDINYNNPEASLKIQAAILGASNSSSENTTKQSASTVGINKRDQDINFDVFLNPNLDPLEHSLMRGENLIGNEDEVLSSSRFSRWFGNKTRTNDIQPSVSPGNMSSAITELSDKCHSKNETNTLLEFLNKLPALPDSKTINKATSITSVEELEARMRANEDSFETLMDISSVPTEKDVRSIDIGLPLAPEQACGTHPEGEIQAFKRLLQKLGSGNMQNHQQHLAATNSQGSALTTPTSPMVPIKPLNVIEAETMVGRSQLPQLVLFKNDEIANTTQLQFNQQGQKNGDLLNVLLSQPKTQQLSTYFATQSEKHLETHSLHQHVTHGDIPIHILEQEVNTSNSPQRVQEGIPVAFRDMPDIPHLCLRSSPDTQQRPRSPLSSLNSEMSLPNFISSNELHPHHIFDQKPNSKVALERCAQQPNIHPQSRQVIPGQRDLQFQTQTNMQNATWKKKIEDQELQQKDRRRQETQRQSQPNKLLAGLFEGDIQQKKNSQIQITNNCHRRPISTQQQALIQLTMQQQPRHMNSSTPLAFTPTSVLRKMTAERDNFNTSSTDKYYSATTAGMQQQSKVLPETTFIKSQIVQQQMPQQIITTQPRMILGGKLSHQQPVGTNNTPASGLTQSRPQSLRNTLAPVNWSSNFLNHHMPAAKPMGRPILKGPMPLQSTYPQQPSQTPASDFMLRKLDFQQIQQQGQKNQTQPVSFPPSSFLIACQQRAVALQRHQHQFHIHQEVHRHHQQHEQPMEIYNRNVCMLSPLSTDTAVNTSEADTSPETLAINYQRGSELSPTTNQLAQWFSPELLAQATAGKLPLLNMNQALSLEEFEKNMQHSSTTVRN